jgi:hypothetical protein
VVLNHTNSGAQLHQSRSRTMALTHTTSGAQRSPKFSLSPLDCPSESYQSVRLRYERTHVLLLIVVVQRVR